MEESEQERRERIKAERRARKASKEEAKRRKKERRLQQIKASGRSVADLHRQAPSPSAPKPLQCGGDQHPATSSDKAHAFEDIIPAPCENTIRLAVVGCGGWFCNRTHLPVLAKIINRKIKAKKAKHGESSKSFDVQITVLCGKADGATRALATLRRNGINLQVDTTDDEKVARFDTLEEYLTYERSLLDANNDAEGLSSDRSRWLADVCLLCIPIPKMVEAVGMCLRAGKCVISEKPVSPNSQQSHSLWEACQYLRAGERWLVSENWAHKASLGAMKRHLHAEIIRQKSRPTAYSLALCQGLDTEGWRANASALYDGGTIRDVGVHVIRVLRRLFGEIDSVCDCKCDQNEAKGNISLMGTTHHGNYISGEISMECKHDLNREDEKAVITVFFGDECRLVWDIAASTIERQENSNLQLLERISGDSWIHGGVKESLEESLDIIAGVMLDAPRRKQVTPKCCPEEAIRDAAVIDSMLECQSGKSVSVRRFCPEDMTIQSSSTFSNMTNTANYQPTNIARCSSPNDVVFATKAACCSGIASQPVGCLNSSNSLQSGLMWIDTSLMDRVLDFQIDQDGQAATVRVEAGMQLSELCTALKQSGFTLPSLPILLDQTLGGALATGSHGSSTQHGTLSDQIVSMRMVLPSGEHVTLVEDSTVINEPHDGSVVVKDSSLLKAARCGVGLAGTTLDVTLQIIPTPTLRKKEIKFEMSDDDVGEKIRTLALSTEHCWIHWRLPSGKRDADDSNDAVAVVLEGVADDSATCSSSDYSTYSARSWYPDGPLMQYLWKDSRKSCDGERKYTAQWSFPMSSLEIVAYRISGLGDQLDSRLVELKFLRSSTKTYLAPNSVEDGSSVEHIVALNVWIDSNDDAIVRLLEQALADVPFTMPHRGKWWFTRPTDDTCILTEEFNEIISNHCRCLRNNSTPADPNPTLSVILPVYNAMPWVPPAVRDCLKQGLDEGEITEVLCGDDCSTDGSLSFLIDLAFSLGDRGSVEAFEPESGSSTILSISEARAILDRRSKICPGNKKTTNPALAMPKRNAELPRVVPNPEVEIIERPLSAEEVAAATHANTRLRVIVPRDDINAGQGEVMTRCLRLSKGRYIGHMESDDERPDGAFQSMMRSLRVHPDWDGVTSLTKCIGWEAMGMERYVAWQNSLTTPELMQRARFLEIPSMHQAGMFRLEAVLKATGGHQGCFRDDEIWPVDTHFWLSFFDQGLVCGKVDQVLFHWRQHPGQQTRVHGRLSIENLRRCKCHYLCKEDGWIWRGVNSGETVRVEVWTSGGSETLSGWLNELNNELRRHNKTSRCTLVGVEWRPGQSIPDDGENQSNSVRPIKRVRLFAFGMEKARQKVRNQMEDTWNDDVDIFVS